MQHTTSYYSDKDVILWFGYFRTSQLSVSSVPSEQGRCGFVRVFEMKSVEEKQIYV